MRVERLDNERRQLTEVRPFEGEHGTVIKACAERNVQTGAPEEAQVSWPSIGAVPVGRALAFAAGIMEAARAGGEYDALNALAGGDDESVTGGAISRGVQPGIYEHYKGNKYRVIGVSRHSETAEITVVYVPLYPTPGPGIANRPLGMFLEEVETPGGRRPRFRYVGDAEG